VTGGFLGSRLQSGSKRVHSRRPEADHKRHRFEEGLVKRYLLAIGLLGVPAAAAAQAGASAEALQTSVDELRNAIGRWAVTTDFLNNDGTVARSVSGTYEFSWITPDRVVSGRSEIPELDQSAGILFYVSEARQRIEMVSVGRDGQLWIMTGALGGNYRLTEEFKTADGDSQQLRFTRFNVTPNAFESRMEYTSDGGRTWKPGNHQRFERVTK
jgi:hypothetical protein